LLAFENFLFLDYITIISSLTSCLPLKCVDIFQTHSCFEATHSIFLNILYLALSSLFLQMARTSQTACKSIRGLPHPIQYPQEVPKQEEPKQPEDVPEFVEVDDDYYGYYGRGWVDTDTEEEPMELPEDHPDAAGDSDKDAAGGDGANPGAVGGDDAEDGEYGSATPDGGDEDPDDDPEPAEAADELPPEPHYEKQIHHLDFAEGPFPALL
jgi:hypothetical protein